MDTKAPLTAVAVRDALGTEAALAPNPGSRASNVPAAHCHG